METDDQKTFLDRIAETCETSKHIREAAAVARESAREIKQRAIQMRTDAEKMRKRRWMEKNAHDRSPS
jgi:hypothetical protein